jgi:hypothetical protein
MPTPPYAKLRASVNGGAPQTGEIIAAGGDTVQFTAESTVGWGSARWEIISFPPGYATPAGWTYDAASDTFYYIGVSSPPAITLSADAAKWGKYIPRLLVNGASPDPTDPSYAADLVDEATGIVVESAAGLRGVGFRERIQFSSAKSWQRDLDADIRTLSSVVGGSPGGSDGEVQTKNGSSFAGATNVKAGSGYVSIGASPAAAGGFRVGNNDGLYGKTFGGTNVSLVRIGTDDVVYVGQPTGVVSYVLAASTNGILRAGTHYFEDAAGAVAIANFTTSRAAFSVPVTFATTVPTAGSLRFGGGSRAHAW